jgi:ketosteroid isomerase-like protein
LVLAATIDGWVWYDWRWMVVYRLQEAAMPGAVLAKREVRKGFDAINRHDLDTVMGMFSEDGVFEFPGDTVLAGRHDNPEAIRAWFKRWFDGMPEIHFTLRHVSVENIFAMGATNVVHAEWDVDETDMEGNSYHVTGVAAFDIKGGKVRLVKDYIFDQDVLSRIWPHKEPPDTEQ